MERAVRGAQPAPVTLAHVVLHLGHEALELGEVRRPQGGTVIRSAATSSAIRLTYSDSASSAEQLGDAHPPVGLGDDEALALQEPQRLADRRAPGAERLAERDLRRDLAGGHVTAEDRLA